MSCAMTQGPPAAPATLATRAGAGLEIGAAAAARLALALRGDRERC
ncbi:hypothetical protein [Sorangium sp. So ce426]